MTASSIDVATLRDWLERGEPVTVLDVRPAAERAEWAIPGSRHVDAYAALRAGDPGALAGADLPAGPPVVTVCAAGRTAALATELLRARGVPALTLAGGMRAWGLAWNTAEVAPDDRAAARVLQVRRTGKGCLSYLVGADGEAAVIDAAVEPEVYLDLAAARGWRIVAVLDTHVHADHLSRSRALAERAGATLYLPATDRVAYPHVALRDGETVAVGAARLAALHTPGHTAESACYLLDGRLLLTGDTLFLEGVGRPDLAADQAEARARARALHGSLRRLLALAPATLVLPGHTGAPVPFDGRALVAPLGEVRAAVAALGLPEAAFVETILARLPPTPPNYHQIVALNESGLAPAADPLELEAGANRCAVA
ncbi:MAG TPA: MBL fold metallo-hydrolase [Thermomicrobiales bacterium]|nr:MBL fold metallo-hydrolase [Thermomicrobiales bacterium]